MANARQLHRFAVAVAAGALVAGSLTAGASGAGAAHARGAGSGPADGRIVYDDGNTGQIFTVNPDGSAKVQITHVPSGQFAVQPAWFPDGSRIVFAKNPGGGDFRLFVMRRNGTHVHRLVAEQSGFADFTPVVTPDGRSVVYSRCRPDPPGGCALFIVRTDGAGRRPLTRYGRGQNTDRSDFWADVSPDGTQVTFTRFAFRGIASQVWVINIDGSNAHRVTRPRLEGAVSRWTPDGRHLLVTSSFLHLGDQIYRMRADGSDLHRLTHTKFPHNNQVAAPSPSGTRIAFVSDRAYSQPLVQGDDLFVMRRNGHRQHSIATGSIFASDWGTAPLLPSTAATPRSALAPARPARQVRAVQRRIEPWR